jgi:transcriptional regulator with XRE-family HTH domain
MILTKMQALKDETKMTYQDIADKSGVPISTVKRIFSGRTPDPGVTTVIAIVEALGGSADDIKGDSLNADNSEHISPKSVEQLCTVYERSLRDKNRLIKAQFITIVAMIAVLLFFLIWDLYNPHIGFIRR